MCSLIRRKTSLYRDFVGLRELDRIEW